MVIPLSFRCHSRQRHPLQRPSVNRHSQPRPCGYINRAGFIQAEPLLGDVLEEKASGSSFFCLDNLSLTAGNGQEGASAVGFKPV